MVAFSDVDGQALGWQRPVSRYVGARFEAEPGSTGFPDIHMVAYDADGNVVDEAELAAAGGDERRHLAPLLSIRGTPPTRPAPTSCPLDPGR